MEQLIIQSRERVALTPMNFSRYLIQEIEWEWRLIGIRGERGTGKTTLLLQQIYRRHGETGEAIYLSLDHIFFTKTSLLEVVEILKGRGILYFYLDEVHKYPSWAREIKNIYDLYPDLYLIFTGSSIIEFNKLDVDLSRRAVIYDLPGLSFREFLHLQGVADINAFDLKELLVNHIPIARELFTHIKPLKYWNEYLRIGYYPYFMEGRNIYFRRLEQIIHLTIESDLSFIEGINVRQSRKILQLLFAIATSVPLQPNVSQLSRQIGIERNTLMRYLYYLEKTRLLNFLHSPKKGISVLRKPEKIFLGNTNVGYALASESMDIGNARETFFLNQVNTQFSVHYGEAGDFWVDNAFTFEVGGKNKNYTQIRNIPNSYIAADNIETGIGNKIPLWMFGFLY